MRRCRRRRRLRGGLVPTANGEQAVPMLLLAARGRPACWERLPFLLLAFLGTASSPAFSWALQDIDDVEPWWTAVRREPLAAGVCPAGQDLCVRGAPDNVCRCDADCSRYGDCCVDRSGSSSSSSDDVTSAASQWRCVLENGREFYALASCPKDAAVDPDLRDHCLRQGMQLKHLQHVPVYSNATRTMYANVFCAACHGDLDALRSWQLELRCNRAWNAEKVLRLLAAGHYSKMHVLHGAEGLSCRLQVADASSESFWHELPGLRECRLAASSCRKGASRRDVLLCSSYTALVYSPRKFSNYRNFHCFRCAGGSASGIVECGARPAARGHDAPDVTHLVLGVRSHFVNPRKCVGHAGSRIYDPLSNACYVPPVPSSDLAGDEPSGGAGAPVQPPGGSAFRLVLAFAAAGLTALL